MLLTPEFRWRLNGFGVAVRSWMPIAPGDVMRVIYGDGYSFPPVPLPEYVRQQALLIGAKASLDGRTHG
jgi:hypothetical protein